MVSAADREDRRPASLTSACFRYRGLDLGPLDPLGELDRSEVDQAAALDRSVLTVFERQPVHGLPRGSAIRTSSTSWAA